MLKFGFWDLLWVQRKLLAWQISQLYWWTTLLMLLDVATFQGNFGLFAEPCTGQEDLTKADAGFKAYLGWKDHELEKTYNVYLAVYVLAQALQDIINCSPGKGLMKASIVVSFFHNPTTLAYFFFNAVGQQLKATVRDGKCLLWVFVNFRVLHQNGSLELYSNS